MSKRKVSDYDYRMILGLGICIATKFLIDDRGNETAIDEILGSAGIDRKELEVLKKYGMNEEDYEAHLEYMKQYPRLYGQKS